MDLGKKDGNRANFGQILAKFNGNQKEMSSESPNSDKVRGMPHRTKIDLNNSSRERDRIGEMSQWSCPDHFCGWTVS